MTSRDKRWRRCTGERGVSKFESIYDHFFMINREFIFETVLSFQEKPTIETN